MKISRKRRATRQIARPKKRTRRTTAMSRMVGSTTTHSFIRKASPFALQGNIAYAPYQNVTAISFSQIANSSEFSALYDQYKLNLVKVQFWLRVDPSAQTAAAAVAPKLYWFRDMDDNVPASMTEMRERAKCKIAVLRTDRPVTVWIKPNVLAEVYRGVGTTTYSPKFGQWLDMTNTDVAHYGVKWNIDNLTNTNYYVDIESTYYFQCKNTR